MFSPRFSVRSSGPARLVMILLALALVVVATFASSAGAKAVVKAPYKVSVTPRSVVAGSTGNRLLFTFTSIAATSAKVSLVVPAVASGGSWSKPQTTAPTSAGYLRALKQTCGSAAVAAITGPASGPWTIVVKATCAAKKHFTLIYGATGPRVTGATKAGVYTFASSAKVGGTAIPLPGPQAVTVTPGALATIELTKFTVSRLGSFDTGVMLVGEIVKLQSSATAYDAYHNVDPVNEPISFELVAVGLDHKFQSQQLVNGTATGPDMLFKIPATVGSVGVFVDDAGHHGSGDDYGWSHAVNPNVGYVKLLNPPVINVPDPISVPSLNMQIKPGSLVVTSNASFNPNGSVSIPVTARTTGNDSVGFTITTSTPVDPVTGNLVLAPAALPHQGDPLVVTSCIGLPFTIPVGNTTVPAFNFGAGTCSGGYQPALSDNPGVDPQNPYIVSPSITGPMSQTSVAFEGFTNITTPGCDASPGLVWDASTQSCVFNGG